MSIVIGVAAVVSVTLATATTRQAHDEMYRALSGKAALEVVTESSDAAYDQAIIEQVRKVPGVRAAVPTVRRDTKLYLGETGVAVKVLGIDPAVDDQVRQYQLVEGKFFDGEQGVLLATDFAHSLGVTIGQEVQLPGVGYRKQSFPVVGILAPQGAAAFSSSGVFLHIKTAQRLFGVRNKVHVTSLLLDASHDSEQVRAAVAALLPPGLIVRPPASQPQMAEETLLATRQGLNTASLLAIVVAAFIMLNAFLMNVSERRRQLSILRAIGATRKQVLNLLLHEGLAMGIIGSILGSLLGIGGAYLLTRAFEQLFQSTLPALRISPLPFILGGGFGIGIALAATYFPALKASRISPLEGMAPVSKEDLDPAPRWLAWLGLAGTLAAALILGLCIADRLPLDFAIPAGIVAMLAFMSVLPGVLEPLSRTLARALFPIFGIEGQLAQRQLVRRRMRTSLTIGVLFLAVTTCIWLGNTITNNTNDVKAWFDRTVIGDFFVRATMPDMATGRAADMPESLQPEIAAIPGVQRVIAARFTRVGVGDHQVIVVSKDFAGDDRLALDIKIGTAADVHAGLINGDAVIGTVLAQRTGLTMNDMIELKTDNGPRRFRIAGVTNEYLAGGLALYLDSRVAKSALNIEGASAFIVRVHAGREAEVEAALSTLCRQHGLLVQSLSSLRRFVDGMQAGVVGGLWVLLGLLLVVAAFGIANTLTMNVLEQTRELGLLRVVAMTRRQVRKTILSQAAMIGLIGLVPGVVIGSGAAWIVNQATQPAFGHPIAFTLHGSLVAYCFIAAYVIVLAAAWFPAERAARLELVTALHYE